MTDSKHRLTRRSFVGASAACLAPSLAVAQTQSSAMAQSRAVTQARPSDHGRVTPPMAVPDVPVVRQDGASFRLQSLLKHHATALQFMFTSCTVTCPIEGAIFARAQSLMPDQLARGIQLLSLSVDPQNDTPTALSRWLSRFHARAGWSGVAPRVEDVEVVRAVGGPGRSPSDNHSTQIYILNREGFLIWRTFELPEAEEIAAILRKV